MKKKRKTYSRERKTFKKQRKKQNEARVGS